MKISNASKKVLASALSAAMVVAFSPALAVADPIHTPIIPGGTDAAAAHTMDNGTVTKEADCGHDGYVTYACNDCDYTYLAAVNATGKHAYAFDAEAEKEFNLAHPSKADGTLDGIAWTVNASGVPTAAVFYVNCPGCEDTQELTAAITSKVTDPTPFKAGKTTYTATATPTGGKAMTATQELPIAQLEISSAAVEFDLDNSGTCRLTLTDAASKIWKYAEASTAAVTAATCAAGQTTVYTAKFDVSGLSAEAIEKLATISYGAGVASAAVDGTTLTVVSTPVATGAVDPKNHVLATAGTAAGHVTTAGGKQTYTENGVTIVYSADAGSIVAGTADTDKGYWTIEAKCSNDGEAVIEKNYATKVSKESCAGGTFYVIEYAGGTYTLKTTAAPAGATHGYVMGEPVWNTTARTFTVDYTCSLCGNKVTVNAGWWGYWDDSTIDRIKLVRTEDIASTCQTEGSRVYTATITKAMAVANGLYTYAAGETAAANGADAWKTFTSAKVPVAKQTHGAFSWFNVQTDWVDADKTAVVTIKCQNCAYQKAIKVPYVTNHVDQVGINAAATAGYTDTYVNFSNPEGFNPTRWLMAGGIHLVANENGIYTVAKDRVADDKAVYAADATNDKLKTACWTVTDADGKKFVPTAVELVSSPADCATEGDNVYKITYNGGKTITATEHVTGLTAKHSYVMKGVNLTSGTITVTEVCSKCEAKATTTVTSFTNRLAENVTLSGSKAKVNVTDLAVSTVVYAEPTFAWDVAANGALKKVTATFVGADKSTITVGMADMTIVPVFDSVAATVTWTATIDTEALPTGFKGNTTDTKVVKLHEGHHFAAVTTVDATATTDGYVKYHCVDCNQDFEMTIPKETYVAPEPEPVDATHATHDRVQTSVSKANTVDAGCIVYYCNDCHVNYVQPVAKDDAALAKTSYTVKASKKTKKTTKTKSTTIVVNNAKGTVSYSVASKVKKAGVSVNKTTGKVTIKKGTKKGTYKVTVKVAATEYYSAVTKTFSVKVK